MKQLLLLIVFASSFCFANAQNVIKVTGEHKHYHKLRVVNQTTEPKFNCIVRVMRKKGEEYKPKRKLGIVKFTSVGFSSTHTRNLKQGTFIGIEMPKDFPDSIIVNDEYADFYIDNYIILKINIAEEENSNEDDF